MNEVRKPRAGAVRYLDYYSKELHVVEPKNTHYKDAFSVASEYWDSEKDQWVEFPSGATTGRITKSEPARQEFPRD